MLEIKTLIIIPAYNEEECIVPVVSNLIENYSEYDYIIVNDGSTDSTKQLCEKNNFNIINLPINLGLTAAVQTGMKYAYINNYDAVIQFDSDGQHLPEYIKPLLDELNSGYDIVIGSRFVTSKKPASLRMAGSFIISFMIRLVSKQSIKDPTSGMRVYNKTAIKEFAKALNYGPEPDTISYLIKRGAKVKEIQVSMNERLGGTSYFNFYKSIRYMIYMTISIVIIQGFRKKHRFGA